LGEAFLGLAEAVVVTIESKFIGYFKTGDNIVHNLDVLALLYLQYGAGGQRDKRLLCKPIILLLVSIVDAVLYDLHIRIREFRRESVQHIIASSLDRIRRMKNKDNFEKYIDSADEHSLLEPKGNALYNQLHELRKLRNRIHIQNKYNHKPANEYEAFTEEQKLSAEKAVEKTLRIMAEKYERKHDYVGEFNLPWDTHCP
jgi:hypothetical protein